MAKYKAEDFEPFVCAIPANVQWGNMIHRSMVEFMQESLLINFIKAFNHLS